MDKPTDEKGIQIVGSDASTHINDAALMRRYWDSMRVNDDVPRRTDVDPRGIQALLEYALIIEKIAPGLARLRIAGQHLNTIMGMEVRGMPITSFITPDHRDQMGRALTELFERPAVVNIDLSAKGSLRRPALAARLMLLPMRSDLGDVSRGLGCLISQGPIGRPPRRFDIDRIQVEPVADMAASRSETLEHGFAEGAADFNSTPSDKILSSERSYLRLVR